SLSSSSSSKLSSYCHLPPLRTPTSSGSTSVPYSTASASPTSPSTPAYSSTSSSPSPSTTPPSAPLPTNGKFNIFWDSQNLSPRVPPPSRAATRTCASRSASVATPSAAASPTSPFLYRLLGRQRRRFLTGIIKQYHLDGIDVDYEHFLADPDTFAECVGRLVTRLKRSGVISFASIAPFDDDEVQRHYLALWKKYGQVIDYVNFQFYAYDAGRRSLSF
ncbi:unnamed protein product, partial [Musa acuminata var. zebrina]